MGTLRSHIEPRGDIPNSSGQGRSGPQTAQLLAMFCEAGSSPPDVSTAMARALEVKSAGLPADAGPWTAVFTGARGDDTDRIPSFGQSDPEGITLLVSASQLDNINESRTVGLSS